MTANKDDALASAPASSTDLQPEAAAAYKQHPAEWILWGQHPKYGGQPLRIVRGTLARCRQERAWRDSDDGWADLVIRGAR